MVEANPVIHYRDKYRGTPLGNGPRPRQIDEPIVPGLEWEERVIGYRSRSRCRRLGYRAEALCRLNPPDEPIARDGGNRRILAQRGCDGLPLRGVRDPDLGGEDRR